MTYRVFLRGYEGDLNPDLVTAVREAMKSTRVDAHRLISDASPMSPALIADKMPLQRAVEMCTRLNIVGGKAYMLS
jgi:hypothetical protein